MNVEEIVREVAGGGVDALARDEKGFGAIAKRLAHAFEAGK